jgi:hypothetical protein
MPRRKVFICYSHEDRDLFERFRTQLDPLTHQDLLEVWTDVEIRAGEDWEPRIYRAIAEADAAVVLVSPDLLASDFVRQNEMPRLLQARRERGLELLPLFLRSSTADLVRFPAEGADPIALTDIQGLNTPAEAIAELPPAAQDRTLAAAARALHRLLPAMPEPVARPRRELTAVLELRDGRVVRRYGQPPWYDLHNGRDRADRRRLRRLAEGTRHRPRPARAEPDRVSGRARRADPGGDRGALPRDDAAPAFGSPGGGLPGAAPRRTAGEAGALPRLGYLRRRPPAAAGLGGARDLARLLPRRV